MPDLKTNAFVNGRIHTMRHEGEICSAIVVRDGKLIYCGDDEQARRMADGDIVDLGGRTVVPGFTDVHQHVQTYAKGLRKVDLSKARSIEEIKELIHLQVQRVEKGKLILGMGFNETTFAVAELPTRHDLDQVASENPVMITRYCTHMNVANSLALAEGGLRAKMQLPHGVERDENGEPNGRLQEREAAALLNAITHGEDMPYDELKDIVVSAIRQANSFGITGIHPIQGKLCNLFEQTSLYQDLRDEGRLTARVYMGDDELPGCFIRTGLGDDMLRYGFYKIYTDGSLGARTALFTRPYSDDPKTQGTCHYTQAELDDMVKQAYDRRIQVGVHAIGDRAIEMTLEALEKAYLANPRPWDQIRFRLIHCSLINEKIIKMLKRLPVLVDIQPGYVATNIHWSDSRVGPERAPYLFAWKTLMNLGLTLSGSSDIPCEALNPLVGIYSVVTRSGYDGYLPQGWQAQERLSRYEAFCLYTKNPAYTSFEEQVKGTIEVGKFADFIVFDRDLFEVPAAELLEAKVIKTYLAGKVVYSAV